MGDDVGGVGFASQGEKHLVYNHQGTEETHIFHQTGGGEVEDHRLKCNVPFLRAGREDDPWGGAPTSDR